MADRYWVGGTGTWNSTSTTNWATSSGGAAGASAPTSVDRVFFDSLSNATAYAVTIGLTAVPANCLDVSISGPLVGNVTITCPGTAVLNCYGSWLNAATGVVFSTASGSNVNFLATTTGKTITTNNVTWSSMAVTMNSATGGWTLGSAFTHTATMVVTAGSFSTSVTGYALASAALSSSGTGVRSISLNSSAVALSGPTIINFSTPTNLTFNAGTSTISTVNAAAVLNGGGQTFYNVTLTQTAFTSFDLSGANTFNNLTFPVKVNTGANLVVIRANQTVTGTLTMTGSTYNTRFSVSTSALGASVTITAGTVSLAYVDFKDTIGAGTASWTGTSIGNCLGNSGITFDTPKTVYWNLAGAQVWSAIAWAPSSGGTPAAANLPLAQDTAVFDNAGAAGTITAWSYNVGTVNMSLRTTTVTFSATSSITVYGNWINGTGVVLSNTGGMNFFGRSLQTITPAGITFASAIGISAFGSTVRILGALTSTNTLSMTVGTLDLNGFTFTATVLNASNTSTRAIAFNGGNLALTGSNTTVIAFAAATAFTYTGTPTVNLTYAGSVGNRTLTFGSTSGATEANALSVYVTAGTDSILFTATSYFKNLDFTGFAGVISGGSKTIYGNYTTPSTVIGPITGTGTTTFAATSGTQLVTSNGIVLDHPVAISAPGATVKLVDNLTVGPTRTLTFNSGTFDLNDQVFSTGIFSSSIANVRSITNFTQRMLLTGQGATLVNIATSALLTVTGTPAVELTAAATTGQRGVSLGSTFPNPEASAWSVYVSAGSDQVNFGTTSSAYMDVDFTGFTGTYGVSNSISVYGSWTFGPGMVTSTAGTAGVTFRSTSATPRTITSNGVTFATSNIVFSGVGGSWQLQDTFNVGSANTTTLTNGTLIMNGQVIVTGIFNCNAATARTLDFSSGGSIGLSGDSATILNMPNAVNLTVLGGAEFVPTYTGSVGTRNFYPPFTSQGGTAGNSVSLRFFGTSTDTITLANGGPTIYGGLDVSAFEGTIAANTSILTVCGDLKLGSSNTLSASNVAWRFGATTGPFTYNNIFASGRTLDFPIEIDRVGGTWVINNSLVLASTRTITLTNGELSGVAASLTAGAFSSSNSNVRSIYIDYGWTITNSGNAWDVSNSTNFTAGGSSNAAVLMTSTSPKTFNGGLVDWPLTLTQVDVGALTVNGGSSFAGLTNATSPTTILFTGGASRNFTSFTLNGTAGNLVTLGSTSTIPATICQSTPWYMGANSVDAGNNTGLSFTTGTGFNDYVSVSYIDGHVNATFPADCVEITTATDTQTNIGVYNVSTADPLTVSDATASNYLWNLIDDTQDANWQNINT